MSPNRLSKLLALQLVSTTLLLAQTAARLELKAPGTSLLVARTMQLSSNAYAESGARVETGLSYSVEPASLATIGNDGLLRGLSPGIITVTAREDSAGISAQVRLEVRPLRIELEPSQIEVRIGETARLSARAIDADGGVIPNQSFRYTSALAAVATLGNDGVVRPVAEGITSVVASIPGTAIAGTGTLRVLRKSDYRLRRLQDSRLNVPAAITAVQEVTAAGTRIAYLATLAHGGQAAIIDENGRRRILVAAGQYLLALERLVVRLTNISINSRGDAAVLADSAENPWCGSGNLLVVFRASGTVEEASGACSIFLHPHALAENGNLTYQVNSGDLGVIREYSVTGVTRTIWSLATRPAEMTEVTGLNWNAVSPSRFGAVLALVSTAKGTEGWHYSADRWQRVFRAGDSVDGSTIQWVSQRAFGRSDGKFFTRFGENGILQMAPNQTRVFTKNESPYANGPRQSWSHAVVDVLGDKVLLNANLIRDDKNLTYLAVVNGDQATTLAETNWMIEGGGFLEAPRFAIGRGRRRRERCRQKLPCHWLPSPRR